MRISLAPNKAKDVCGIFSLGQVALSLRMWIFCPKLHPPSTPER